MIDDQGWFLLSRVLPMFFWIGLLITALREQYQFRARIVGALLPIIIANIWQVSDIVRNAGFNLPLVYVFSVSQVSLCISIWHLIKYRASDGDSR